MGLPKNNREIIIIKQGGKKTQYDENSRKVEMCIWEEVADFKCVDHMPTSRGAESDATTTHGLETNRQLETFYFSMHNQTSWCDYDLRHGYYIVQRLSVGCNADECPEDANYQFWKIVANRQYEILPGCWDFKITGERLAGRESERMMLECKPHIKLLQGIITHE